eukprot:Phypoly_transcript_16049.p1 GENE.Phypoly_transcript_16049~~Phypoly_transcript_16049.p1  ORF type:complete len:109 (+),score=13.96 Phypoly_transcript_16049:35-328(+)
MGFHKKTAQQPHKFNTQITHPKYPFMLADILTEFSNSMLPQNHYKHFKITYIWAQTETEDRVTRRDLSGSDAPNQGIKHFHIENKTKITKKTKKQEK